MNIQSAQYQKDPLDSSQNAGIVLLLHGDDTKYYVPLSTENRHYQAIQEWVSKGNTIQEAD